MHYCNYGCNILHTIQWRHNERDGVTNHQPHNCLLNRLFKRRSKKTSKLRATGLCAGNSPITGESPHKGPVTRKNVSIWWRHQDRNICRFIPRTGLTLDCACWPGLMVVPVGSWGHAATDRAPWRHWRHRRLSLRQLTVPPVTTMLSNWRPFSPSDVQASV